MTASHCEFILSSTNEFILSGPCRQAAQEGSWQIFPWRNAKWWMAFLSLRCNSFLWVWPFKDCQTVAGPKVKVELFWEVNLLMWFQLKLKCINVKLWSWFPCLPCESTESTNFRHCWRKGANKHIYDVSKWIFWKVTNTIGI